MKTFDRLIIFLGPFSSIGSGASGMLCASINMAIAVIIGIFLHNYFNLSFLFSFVTHLAFFFSSVTFVYYRASKLYKDTHIY